VLKGCGPYHLQKTKGPNPGSVFYSERCPGHCHSLNDLRYNLTSNFVSHEQRDFSRDWPHKTKIVEVTFSLVNSIEAELPMGKT
jgi:hypothetical protein